MVGERNDRRAEGKEKRKKRVSVKEAQEKGTIKDIES